MLGKNVNSFNFGDEIVLSPEGERVLAKKGLSHFFKGAKLRVSQGPHSLAVYNFQYVIYLDNAIAKSWFYPIPEFEEVEIAI